MENWKTIKNHENYSVSNLGEIKNTLTGELLKKHNHPKGYDQVYFAGHTFLVHKIVCEAFHENPENKPCVDHIDGNKKNNSASNLRWVSYKENNSNPNTSWKNSHPGQEPWNKGQTGIYSEETLKKMMLGSIKGGETMKRKATEIRKSPEWEKKVEEYKERQRVLQRNYYAENKDWIRAKDNGMTLEEYLKMKEERSERARQRKEAHERAQARKQYKIDHPDWKKEERMKYWEEHRDELSEKRKQYRAAHLDEIREKDKLRKRKNKEA